MKWNLRPFTIENAPAIQISVDFDSNGKFTYLVSGETSEIDFELNEKETGRKDELWKKTCFEFFIMDSQGFYGEFNFSPAGSWNYYTFTDYRKNQDFKVPMKIISVIHEQSKNEFKLESIVEIPKNFGKIEKVNPTTVIKTLDGNISYWAAHHSQSKPDFHHVDGFQKYGN